MKIKTLGLLVLSILLISCKDKTPPPPPPPPPQPALTVEQFLYESDSVCSNYLYIYTTVTIGAEKKRFEFLRDSLAEVHDTSVLAKRIAKHLEKIKIAEDYFASLPPTTGFYAAGTVTMTATRTKPPCPCPTSGFKATSTCQCFIYYIATYDVGGTLLEMVSVNKENLKVKSDTTYRLINSKAFELSKPLQLHEGDTLKLRMSIQLMDSTGNLVPQTIEHTEIIK